MHTYMYIYIYIYMYIYITCIRDIPHVPLTNHNANKFVLTAPVC
jgi:hypothetical protein